MSFFQNMHSKLFIATVFMMMLVMAGCTRGFPLPGGNDRINEKLYESDDDLLKKLADVKRGMTYGEVFQTLGHQDNDLIIMSRAEIIQALYGSSDVRFDGSMEESLHDMDNGQSFLQTLYGYKFTYRVTDREHGLQSPIRLRTDENGYSYTVRLIFRGGKLFENPIVSGGIVDTSSSRTLFDHLNPFSLVGTAL